MNTVGKIVFCVAALGFLDISSCKPATPEYAKANNFTLLANLPKARQIGARNALYVSDHTASWQEAIAYCYGISGVFLSIDDHLFDESIRMGLVSKNLVQGQNFWTSGRFSYSGEPLHLDTYMWAGNGRQMIYTNWWAIYGEPSGSWAHQTCVTVRATGYLATQYGWATNNCANKLRFICLC